MKFNIQLPIKQHVELTKGREDNAGTKRFIDPIKLNIKGLKTFQLETKQIHQFLYNVTYVLQIQVILQTAGVAKGIEAPASTRGKLRRQQRRRARFIFFVVVVVVAFFFSLL